MLTKSILAALLLVMIPTNAHADGCTENCVVEINCTTGVTIVREMTPQELANRPVFNPIPEPVTQATPVTPAPTQPVTPAPSEPVVIPTVDTSTVIASMPQPPKLDTTTQVNKVIVNASTNTATVLPLTVDEIIDMWLRDWEAWFFHWSAYMNEYWSW
jgi:hypothetical protein